METAVAEAPLEQALGNFMTITAKSSVAVVIPMYGYWNDIENNPVNGEVLNAVLRRIYSNVHHLYFVFVANPPTIEHDSENPDSVGNIILSKVVGGNVLNVPVPRDATYSEYVKEGIESALEKTNAQFIVVFNPWVLIQDGALDVLVDRSNYGDEAKVISGFNFRDAIAPEAFDQYKTSVPREEYDISCDFLGMPRYVAEMVKIDPQFQTHQFLERDIWQQMTSRGFSVITSQRIPIFSFDFPWSSYESQEAFQSDGVLFGKKWGFNPGLVYKADDPRE